MLLNIRSKLTILAGAVALAVGAPAAFAQAQGQSGMHQDPGGTPDAPAARHSEQVMKKKSTHTTDRDGGKSSGGVHQDAGGAPDAPAARHSEQVMKKKSKHTTKRDEGTTKGGMHQDPGGTPDSPAARHSEKVK